MKKLLIALALPLWAMQAHGQTFTTYGPTDPQSTVAGYISDYSPGGTIVMAGGSVTMTNGSTYEHGNLSFQNNGTWSSQTGSLDLFNGPGAVTISGTTAPEFFDLQFLNGGAVAVTNTGGANVASQLLFGTSGFVSTVKANHSNGAIRFADNATYTGGTTDAQHVNGYVTKAGNDAFTFPVGAGTDVRTLSISAPAATNTISAAWFPGNPGTVQDPSDGATHSVAATSPGIPLVSQVGFWDYILTAGNDDGLIVTVSIPDMFFFATAANLRLAGWNGTQWIDLSGGPNASGNTENSMLTGTIPAGQSITALAIASTSSTPLPVSYAYFNATANGCTAALDWEAHIDAAFEYFSVERSIDGKLFTKIGSVTESSAPGSNKYSYRDEKAAEGVNYYRIRDVSAGGNDNVTATKSVIIHCMDKAPIKLYPTTTAGTVYIEMPAGYEKAKVMVIALNGQQVPVDITKDGLFRTVQLSALAAGQYFVKVESNSAIETFKILYQP